MKLDHHIHGAPSGRILLAVLVVLFTLCAGPANSASELGTVKMVLLVEPIHLDFTASTRESVSHVLVENVAEALVDRDDATNTIVPRLATSWKQIDATTWRFFLRKGVKFHDGTDFNAEAVIFTMKRLFNKKLATNVRSMFFSGVEMTGRAIDSHTVEIKLDKPQPIFLDSLTWLLIGSPNTPWDKFTRNPIGTGPYKFVKWDAGVEIVTERFDDYWGKLPEVKKAIYVWRNELPVRAAMVAIGEADLTSSIGVENANRPDMDHVYLDSETIFVRISTPEPPFNDRRVRMALNYAVDRNAIRGSILSKDSLPATQMYVPSTFGHNPNLKPWPYDPQKAKQLLDEARKDGVPVHKEILLVGRIAHFPGAGELCEALMAMYKAVGLNVKLKIFEYGVYNTYMENPPPPNIGPCLVVAKHNNSSGDPKMSVYYNYHCKGVRSSMCDKRVDDLIEKAQAASGEERKNLWQTLSKVIHEDIIPNVMLFHEVSYARVGKRINFKPSMDMIYKIPLNQITFK